MLLLELALLPSLASARSTYVISDLHFGVGRDASGNWDTLEDFRWHASFKAFLGELERVAPDGVTLVLNGDTFELWQSPEHLVPPPAPGSEPVPYGCPIVAGKEGLGCSESAARNRLARILGNWEHADSLRRLRSFAERRGNQVVIVPGNHDAALLYASVRNLLRTVVGDKVQIPESGHWIDTGARILFEHGHQMDPLNAMEAWPTPFVPGATESHLDRPWGESFVSLMFDPRERQYPIVDNVSDHFAGIGYLLSGEAKQAGGGFSGLMAKLGTLRGGAREFFRFMVLRTSREQLGDVLGSTEDADDLSLGGTAVKPEWDVASIRLANDPELLRAMVPSSGEERELEALRFVVEWTITEGGGFSGLTDDEIRTLCGALSLRRKAPGARICPVTNLDETSLGATQNLLLSSPNKVFVDYLKDRRRTLGATSQQFDTYVYSHTHRPRRPCSPFNRHESWRPVVINTGAWQRTASAQFIKARLQAESAAAAAGQDDPFGAFRAQPEDLAACYGVVRIGDSHPRSPRVLFWVEAANGQRGFRSDCPRDECLLSSRAACDPNTPEPGPFPAPDAVCTD